MSGLNRGVGASLLLVWVVAAGCAPAPSSTVEASAPSLDPILVDRGSKNPEGAALGVVDGSCIGTASIDFVPPDLAAVDAAIATAGGAWGTYDAGGRQAYFGPVEAAARAFGASALFIGANGHTWIRTAPGKARELVRHDTPAKRAVWMTGDESQIAPCGQPTP